MVDFFTNFNKWLSRKMFIVVLSGVLLGIFLHIQDSLLLRNLVIGLFAYMTFVTALTTGFSSFFKVLRHPNIPLWILALVHVITPLFAYLIGLIFYANEPYIRIGYLVGASIPIAVTSLIWVSLVRGDLAISLVAVILDTLIVPVILPIFFNIIAGQVVQFNYEQMVIELLLMVTLPSLAGMVLHDLTQGKIAKFAAGFGGATSKIALFVVILINSALVMPQINWDLSIIKALLVTLLVVATGYFVGYLGTLILKKPTHEVRLTMIYNVGMRNNACGLVIALSYFAPSAAIPITLAMLFQQPIATLIPRLYKHFTKVTVY